MAASDFILPFLFLALILTVIKTSQVVFKKFDLPEVLGELLVGIILGPTVLGILYLNAIPSSSLSIFLGIEQGQLDITALIINFISNLAVLLLLFKVGMELDFHDMIKVRTPAFLNAGAGIILMIAGGVVFFFTLVGMTTLDLQPNGVDIWHSALFLGVAFTATSIGISTRLFCDYKKLQTKVAQTVVASAIFDDILAVALFSFVIAYFTSAQSMNPFGLPIILINIIVFFAVSYLLYKYVLPYFFLKTKKYDDKSLPIFVSLSLMLYMAFFAQMLGLAPIIGAFVAGVIIGNEDEYLDIHDDFEAISSWIIPFFFISIGLTINLLPFLNIFSILIALFLVVVAIVPKYVGGIFGSYFGDYDKGEAKTIGLSMAVRGEVTLFFAYTGYSLGYFTETLYGIVILSVILVTFILIPLLKHACTKWLPENGVRCKSPIPKTS
ncbi:MAG: putative Kef-type K+ transport system, membrane component [Candidatus Thorarchaeota archaeon]|nr:MAG: putative Kef-type K+ transport system, membrane component [Candidatus Thorarchaeota archaeon]